jgi:hypothetical protein
MECEGATLAETSKHHVLATAQELCFFINEVANHLRNWLRWFGAITSKR